VCVAWTSVAQAQIRSATLTGTVTDPQKAIVPGATVVVTNEGTNASQELVTNEDGFFTAPLLPAGTVLHMTAYHDNSVGNKENPDPNAFVGWGSRTVDEMNIGWLDFYYITDQEYTDLQKQNADKSRSTQLQQQ